jgi:anti-sigma factor RsiW
MMTHDDVLARLDARADGTLSRTELTAVEAHLAGCEACRREAEALERLLAETRALPRSIMPERELWDGIEARLAPRGGAVTALPTRRRTPLRPMLLAAAIAGILLGGTAVALVLRRAPADPAFVAEQQRYLEASAELARALAQEPGHLAPETQAVVRRSLAIVDQAIAEAEAALTDDPGNRALEQMLLARYEQRLELLRRANEAGRRES